MYLKVTDKNSVEKIKNSLNGQKRFYTELNEKEKKHGAETSLVFHSLSCGLKFSCLWFKQEDKDKIDTSLFKVTYSVRNKTTGEYGHEARPRKTNKKFYAEFMKGIEDFSYSEFTTVLFGKPVKYGLSIEFKERQDGYYFSINRDIILGYQELTASQYKNA